MESFPINLEESLKERRNILIIGVLFSIVLIMSLLFSGNLRTTLNLKSSASLDYIEDNNIGFALVQRGTSTPQLIDVPELKACIYSSQDTAPVIIPVESDKVLISTSQLETVKLNLSIPEEKLGENFSTDPLNITRMQKCPLRSTPQIVVTNR